MIPPELRPVLPDPEAAAQRAAITIIGFDRRRRLGELRKIHPLYRTLALAVGCAELAADDFADYMHGLVCKAVRTIEVSGGGVVGRG